MSSHSMKNMLFRSDGKADKLETWSMKGSCSVPLRGEIAFRRLVCGFTFRAMSPMVAQLACGLRQVDAVSQPHDFQPWHGANAQGCPEAASGDFISEAAPGRS